MPIEIEAPDGSIVEFPDGTDDAKIISVMRKNFGGPAAAQTASGGLFDDLIPEANRAPDSARGAAAGPWTKYQQPQAQGPWKKYQQAPATGPWTKYQKAPSTGGMFDDLIPAPQPEDVRGPTGVPGGTTATPAPAAPVNRGMDAPIYVAQQADRGIADAVGMPVDLAAAGLNIGLMGADKVAEMFGGNVDARITDAVGGSDWIANNASKIYEMMGGTVVPPEAVSPKTRSMGASARFGTGAAIGGATLASKPLQMAAQSPGTVNRFLSPLTEPYRNSARAVVGDAAAGAGAGLGAQSYEEYAPDNMKETMGPLGPAISALAGGAGGAGFHAAASGLGSLAGNSARSIVRGRADPQAPVYAATGQPFTRSEMDEAARAVQAQASNPRSASANIADSIDQFEGRVRPGEMPTTGSVSGDAGLTLLEKEARARNPKPFLERDQRTNTRAGELVREIAPKGSEPRDFTNTANAIRADRLSTAQAGVDAARQAEQAAAAAARRQAEPIAAGAGQGVRASQGLDEAIVGQSLRPMQDRKNTAFAAIDPDRSVVRDANPLIEAAANIRGSLGRLNDPNSVLPTRTLDRIAALAEDAGGAGTITFNELNALRPELSSALVKARATGDFALADNVQALQRAINVETNRLASEATDAGRRAADAQGIYQNEFAPVWNPGPGDEATKFRRDVNADRAARTQSPPSATAGRFMRPGQPEKAESLRRIMDTLPNRQAAEAEARRFLIADLAESGVVDAARGNLRPDVLRRWRNQWGDAAIDVVPGFRAEVDGILSSADMGAARASKLAQDVRAAETRLDDVVKNRGALGLVLGKDPVNAVQSIFGSKDPERAMALLVKEVGTNKKAADGLKSSVVEYLTHKVSAPAVQKTADGSRPIDFAKLENVFDRHAATLTKVFSPEEMNSLRQAHKLLKPQMAIKQPGGVASLYDNKKRDQAWVLLEGGLKARFGVLKGGGILRTIRIFTSTLPNRDEAIKDIVLQMHFDPELAKHLLSRSVDVSDPIWNAKLNRLLAVATAQRGAGDEDDVVKVEDDLEARRN